PRIAFVSLVALVSNIPLVPFFARIALVSFLASIPRIPLRSPGAGRSRAVPALGAQGRAVEVPAAFGVLAVLAAVGVVAGGEEQDVVLGRGEAGIAAGDPGE